MGSGKRRETFAEVVRALKDAPVVAVTAPPPSSVELVGDGVRFPDGTAYTLVGDAAPAEVRAHVVAGAPVVWDACGCAGGCPLVVLDPDDVRHAAEAGPPRLSTSKRRGGAVSVGRADDGRVVVLVEGWVAWGDLLA
ncbi:MAG: hypothetical protein U0Q15_04195 [Kineosporiaceae bacterium]